MIQNAVDTYGFLDVLVNNAGIETRTSILNITEADYQRVLDVTSRAPSSAPGSRRSSSSPRAAAGSSSTSPPSTRTGRCPGTSPTASPRAEPGCSPAPPVSLGPHQIRVVNIGPGAVATPINTSTMNDPAKLQALDAAIPLRRMAQPAEIADVVVFLASGKSAYLPATTVFIDGGIMQGSVGL